MKENTYSLSKTNEEIKQLTISKNSDIIYM